MLSLIVNLYTACNHVLNCKPVVLAGSYTAESVLDFSWALVSMGVLYIIYFVPVQLLAYVSIFIMLLVMTWGGGGGGSCFYAGFLGISDI